MEAVEEVDDVIHEDVFDLDSSESSASDEEEIEVGFEVGFFDPYDGQDEEDIGGYEYEFVDEVSESQKCPVCLWPMRDAVQTSECGHRFCKACLQRILRDDHPVCPNDRREIQEEGGYFYDKAWARDILCLRVKCKRNERGCDWIGQLRHAEDHKGECDYEDDTCLACGVDIQRRLKETHLNEECPKRIIECVHCQDEYTFIQKQEHEGIYCRRFPLVCTNNCGREEIPREEMELHLLDECPMTEVICPYSKAGCPFQDKRAHLNDHIEASVEDHLELTWSSLADTKQELDNMKDLRQKFHQIQEVNQKLTESMADSREEVRDLTLAVKSLEMQNIQQKKRMEDMARKMAKGMQTESLADSRKEVQVLKLEMRKLQMQNLQLKHSIENMSLKVARDAAGLKLQMAEVNAPPRTFRQLQGPPIHTVTFGSLPTSMSREESAKIVHDVTETSSLISQSKDLQHT